MIGIRYAHIALYRTSDLIENRVSTAMVYAHVLNRGGRGVRSPADELGMSLNVLRP